jgi:xanthine dehydrogenase YagS FAD-binding subunit
MSDLILAENIDVARAQPGELRAGGTDLQDRRRLALATGPIVDISRITELKQIHRHRNGSTDIGALVTLAEIAEAPQLIEKYPGLAMACGALATPQIRTMATLGGSLLQRTRCWYYRNPAFDCFKKGGNSCPARSGDHRYGVVFDRGSCAFPHPSTPGMVLLAYEAEFSLAGGPRQPIAALYGDGSDPQRDHTLAAGELLSQVYLPPPLADERASYFRAISRARAEWPLVEAIVRLKIEAGHISFARVAVGGVAGIPLRLPQVEAILLDQPAGVEIFMAAAQAASEGARPLPMTGYKLKLLQGTVYEALQRAYQRVWGGEG